MASCMGAYLVFLRAMEMRSVGGLVWPEEYLGLYGRRGDGRGSCSVWVKVSTYMLAFTRTLMGYAACVF